MSRHLPVRILSKNPFDTTIQYTRLHTANMRTVILIFITLMMCAVPVQAASFPFSTCTLSERFTLFLTGEADSGAMTVSEQSISGEWRVEIPTSTSQDDWTDIAQWKTYARNSGFIIGNPPGEDTSYWDFLIEYRLENAASAQMDLEVEMSVGNHHTTTVESIGQVIQQGEGVLYVDIDLEDFEIPFEAGDVFEITLSVKSFTLDSPIGDSTFEFVWGQGRQSYLEGISTEWWITTPDIVYGDEDGAEFTVVADYNFDDGPILRDGWYFELSLDTDGDGSMEVTIEELDWSELNEGVGIIIQFAWVEKYAQPSPHSGIFDADLNYCESSDGDVKECVGIDEKWMIEFDLEQEESDSGLPPDTGGNSSENETGEEENNASSTEEVDEGGPLSGFTFIEAFVGLIMAIALTGTRLTKTSDQPNFRATRRIT